MADAFELSSRMVDEIAAHWPTHATYSGVPGHDHEWPDFSPAGHAAWQADLERWRAEIEALPEPPGPWHDLAGRVAATFVDQELDDAAHDEHLLDLNSIDSTLQTAREIFEIMERATEEGWGAIAARMEGLPEALAGYRATLDEGRRRGLTVARRQVLSGIEQSRQHADPASYFASLPEEHAATEGAEPALTARLAAAVGPAAEAFGGLADYLESAYLPDARRDDAVGEPRYVRLARRYLGTVIDPGETYEWGWTEVERLRTQMREVAGRIAPGSTLASAIEVLKTDVARAAPSREEFLKEMRERQELALRELQGTHFDVPDEITTVDVKIAPTRGALGAYYIQPSEDFSRPGCVWYSLAPDQEVVPLYDQVSTAYHEGFPGHHLQCGIQVALADRLSRLHRLMVWYAGYGEGWALYTERLMDELGYLEKPDYVLGMLAAQMLRACRVVIDIGSHLELPIPAGQPFHPGEPWTFETAVEMLVDYATLDDDYARSEVTRYLGWPGQAISYKVGERVILDLRDELRERQGDAFDLKEFHRRVLGHGPVGLDLLRELVLAGA